MQWSRDCEAPWNCIGTDRLPIDSLCRDGLQRNTGSLAICPGNCGTGGLLQYYGGVVEPDRDCKADLDCSSIWELARNWIDPLLLQQLACIPQILVRFGQSPYNPFAIKTDCKRITGSLVNGPGICLTGIDCSLIQELARKELTMRLLCNASNQFEVLSRIAIVSIVASIGIT